MADFTLPRNKTAHCATQSNRLLPAVASQYCSDSGWQVGDRCRWATIYVQLCQNMTSYKHLEVHNILCCCQRRTEPHPQVTCAENFITCGFKVSGPTDSKTGKMKDKETDTDMLISW